MNRDANKERKYYRIRSDYFWGSLLCISALILAFLFFHLSADKKAHSDKSTVISSDRGEINFENLTSTLKDQQQCYLCGNAKESLMGYYRNFDTIGLISLNDWYVLDFPVKQYNENGKEIVDNTASTSLSSGNTGEISYTSNGMPSRRMAEIDVRLPDEYSLNTDFLEKHLCSRCIKKVADSLQYYKSANENAIPLCMVDFETLNIYPLQSQWKSYFIRDYYVEINSGDSIDIKTFFLPEIE